MARYAHIPSEEKSHKGVAFLFGFSLLNYIGVIEPIKIVDLATLLALAVFHRRLTRLTFTSVILICWLLVAVVSTGALWFSLGKWEVPLLVALAQMIAAFVVFQIVATLKRDEMMKFRQGLVWCGMIMAMMAIVPFWVPSVPSIIGGYNSTTGAAATGTLPDPSRFGAAMGICIFVMGQYSILRRVRVGGVLMAMLAGMALIYSNSRGAVLWMCVALGIVGIRACLRGVASGKWAALGLLLGFVVTAIFVEVNSGFLESAWAEIRGSGRVLVISKFETRDIANDPRMLKNTMGLEAWKERPVLGWGVDGFSRHANVGTSHNSYLEVLVNFGIIGVGLMCALLFAVIWTLWRSPNAEVKREPIWSEWGMRWGLSIFVLLSMTTINLQFVSFAYGMLGYIANRSEVDGNEPQCGRVHCSEVQVRRRVAQAHRHRQSGEIVSVDRVRTMK